MNAIAGAYQQGRILLHAPVDWPDGASVEVSLVQPSHQKFGMTEGQWQTNPEGIANLLARMDQCEPLDMTPEEEADLATWRRLLASGVCHRPGEVPPRR
jgi:hypothetical protein